MDRAGNRQDQLCLGDIIHTGAGSQFALCPDPVTGRAILRGHLPGGRSRSIRPHHRPIVPHRLARSNRLRRPLQQSPVCRGISIRLAASRMACTAMATVYESPVVTGISSALAIVIPASPTTEVNAPRSKHLSAKFLGEMTCLNNLTINCPFWQLHHAPGCIRAGDKPTLYLFARCL